MLSRRAVFAAPALLAAPIFARADMKGDVQAKLDEAARSTGVLHLGPGTYRVDDVKIGRPVMVTGVPGRTRLVARRGPALSIAADDVTLQGIGFEGEGDLVVARDAKNLRMDDCSFAGGTHGLVLERSGGRVRGCNFSSHRDSALYANDSVGLEISGNRVDDCANNGIQVFRSAFGEDGTIVSQNRITGIAARDGGSGQYGNGVSVFRAGAVQVINNIVSDCAYSAVRNNSGSGVSIIGNTVRRCNETALYSEFEFEGCIISNNMVEDVAFGISIANFDVGGRLAVCSGNLVRQVRGGHVDPEARAGGILCTAETIVTGNLIEDALIYGIQLGWGRCRNLIAADNIVRRARHGIEVSVAEGAESLAITGNTITAGVGIQGMDHSVAVGGDLLQRPEDAPRHVHVVGNRVGAE